MVERVNKVLMLKDQIFNFVKTEGPALPAQVSKHLNSSLMFVSALLSELTSNEQLKLTHAKIGGSPLYYATGQEYKLAQMLKAYMGPLALSALELIEQKKIIYDAECDPTTRLALKELKDFAVLLKVKVGENEEMFWKWFLLTDQDTKELIGKKLEKLYKKEEVQKPLTEQKILKDKPKRKYTKKKPVKEKDIEISSEDKTFAVDFENVIIELLKMNNITIIEKQIIKKNREFNFVVKIPSSIGDLTYFVKAKNKRTVNEGELLLAFTEGQGLKLPTLYISNAELNKKTQLYMDKNMRGISYKKI